MDVWPVARPTAPGRWLTRPAGLLADERGTSLVEFLVAIAIGGLLVPTALATIMLIYRTSVDATDRLAVTQDSQNIVGWLRRDLMPGATGNNRGSYGGQTIAASGTSLTIEQLELTGGSAASNTITYRLTGQQLVRQTTRPATSRVIGRHIQSLVFDQAGAGVTVALTSRAGQQSLSLTTQISPRSQ